jgi:CAAX protease family protein
MKWPGLPTIIGLVIALGGPAALAGPWGRVLGDPGRRSTHTKDQLAMWGLLGIIVAIIILGERQSLASIGLHAPTWGTLGWGVAATALVLATGTILFPFLMRAGIVDYSRGLALIEAWPLWLILFAVVTSGVEEVFYRGYAIERVASITGSYVWAAVFTVIIFGLVHAPFWGRGAVFWTTFGGGVLAVLYIWKHDLLACIVAHILCNFKALVIDTSAQRRRVLLRGKSATQSS